METPTPEEHEQLMASVETRSVRQAQRIAEPPIDFSERILGRVWPEFEGNNRLAFEMPDSLPFETVKALAKKVQTGRPLFDMFSKHYQVDPNPYSIDEYTTAANVRNKSQPTNQEERDNVRASKMRQTQHITDMLERELFDDRNIARLRRASIKTIRYQIQRGETLDRAAAIITSNALVDFGQCLRLQTDVLENLKDVDLAVKIIHIGEAAAKDPQILLRNLPLLKLVQIEQKKRDEYWSVRFDAVFRYTGDRLTKLNKADGEGVKTELARLESICQS